MVVDKDPRTGETNYQASSPDELALMQGAKQAGMVLVERSAAVMKIKNECNGRIEEYEILKEFPFDSDRKRMTLIVKHEGSLLMLVKGADSIMLKRVLKDNHHQQQSIKVQRELLNFAKEGLRTLVVCQKEMSQNDYSELDRRIYEIQTSEIPLAQKEEALADLYDSYE